MTVKLNHTIVAASDKAASARFLVDVLGLPEPTTFGPFVVVQVDNDVSLDYMDTPYPMSQHYAFLVDEETFDAAFERIRAAGIAYWADPGHRVAGEINTNDGGRGLYFEDPDGHNMEIITVPYGG